MDELTALSLTLDGAALTAAQAKTASASADLARSAVEASVKVAAARTRTALALQANGLLEELEASAAAEREALDGCLSRIDAEFDRVEALLEVRRATLLELARQRQAVRDQERGRIRRALSATHASLGAALDTEAVRKLPHAATALAAMTGTSSDTAAAAPPTVFKSDGLTYQSTAALAQTAGAISSLGAILNAADRDGTAETAADSEVLALGTARKVGFVVQRLRNSAPAGGVQRERLKRLRHSVDVCESWHCDVHASTDNEAGGGPLLGRVAVVLRIDDLKIKQGAAVPELAHALEVVDVGGVPTCRITTSLKRPTTPAEPPLV